MSFKKLDLIEPLYKALTAEGYTKPTPIQEQAIPAILKKRDLLGCAQTGTGKTAAFALPVIQLLSRKQADRKSPKKIRTLILTPTRELAIQIDESFKAYGKFAQLNSVVVYGGVSQKRQTDALQKGTDILTATPGRLLDLIQQGFISLSDIEIFILDEADRMLDMGFVHDVKRIITLLPKKRQTLFFSATMPREIIKLAGSILTKPKEIIIKPKVETADLIRQQLYYVAKYDKPKLLLHVLKEQSLDSALVFTRTKHGANKVAKSLIKSGIKAEAIHGNKSQNARQQALNNFKDKKIGVLVATDIAARGIDVDDLSCVINYEIPNISETYIHRIGRTGRAGSEGLAVSFCDSTEKSYIRDITKLMKKDIPLADENPYPIDKEKEAEVLEKAEKQKALQKSRFKQKKAQKTSAGDFGNKAYGNSDQNKSRKRPNNFKTRKR
jgi:ATP-dependent RNA helicase RhlE